MGAIEMLKTEHRLISKVLGALEKYVEAVVSNQPVDRADLAKFVTFIREFADRCHHGKEEDILFETMIENGFPRDAGPIAVMLHEHDEGRRYISAMSEAADRAGSWTDEDRSRIRRAAMSYSELLRAHIMKEDQILYPMAQARLPDAALEQVDRDCATFEARQVAAGADALKDLARDLVQRHAG